MTVADESLLQVKDLVTVFHTEAGLARAVNGVNFELKRGKTLGVVGESGCGKSVTALSIMGLLPKPSGQVESGEILYGGKNLARLPAEEMYRIRGRHIAMIFQEPMTALNPVYSIYYQLAEILSVHFPTMTKGDLRDRCVELLTEVGIPAPEMRLNDYPHQLSGGMRQRVMIAIALACSPDILICDEPTTALDVTVQAQILDLMKELQEKNGMSLLFITHDLGVIAEVSDEVLVMYGGRCAEYAPVKELFKGPKHPYTKRLLQSMPRLTTPRKSRLPTIPGMVPGIFEMPGGCRFANRCDYALDICKRDAPEFEACGSQHRVACVRWRDID